MITIFIKYYRKMDALNSDINHDILRCLSLVQALLKGKNALFWRIGNRVVKKFWNLRNFIVDDGERRGTDLCLVSQSFSWCASWRRRVFSLAETNKHLGGLLNGICLLLGTEDGTGGAGRGWAFVPKQNEEKKQKRILNILCHEWSDMTQPSRTSKQSLHFCPLYK